MICNIGVFGATFEGPVRSRNHLMTKTQQLKVLTIIDVEMDSMNDEPAGPKCKCCDEPARNTVRVVRDGDLTCFCRDCWLGRNTDS